VRGKDVYLQLKADRLAGRPWPFFFTFTLDRAEVLAELELPEWAGRTLSQRYIAKPIQTLVQALRREGFDWRYVGRIEGHGAAGRWSAGWAHRHDIVVSQRLLDYVLEEAGAQDVPELLEAQREYLDMLLPWEEWDSGGRRGPRPSRPRLPWSQTRQDFIRRARRAGLGSILYVEPLRSTQRAAEYLCKDGFYSGSTELAKAEQVLRIPLLRNTKTWRPSQGRHRFFIEVRAGEGSIDHTTDFLAIHDAELREVREMAAKRGVMTESRRLTALMKGKRPSRGEKWARAVESAEAVGGAGPLWPPDRLLY